MRWPDDSSLNRRSALSHSPSELLAQGLEQIVEWRTLPLEKIDFRRHARLQPEFAGNRAIELDLSDVIRALPSAVGEAIGRDLLNARSINGRGSAAERSKR